MSAMQAIVETVDISNAPPSASKKLKSWRGDVKFSWADEYVYGIDFDNRLVKTAKVSAFFNGDGDATIIWGDGLDSFEHSDVYRGKLKQTLPNKQDNGQFDILISNPPYSVEAFRRMLKHGSKSFDLYSSLTDNSSEIECLFIERVKQLLKVGGWAGVILPSSMLSNGGIYSRARDIIFKYFYVKAIVELGSGTFMETGTNTVILFLERRPDSDHEKIAQAINTFFTSKRDVTVMGIERAFSAYVANAYEDLSYEDYLSFINESSSNAMIRHELFKDYAKEFGDYPYAKAFEVEKEKMLYFLLTYNQNIVVAKSGQKQDEKAFLGYEFSKRRGHEGIRFLPKGTMLFDESDILNPQKVNSYICNAFISNSSLQIDDAVANHISYGCMSGFFEYGTSKFGKRVNLKKSKIQLYGSKKYLQVKLGDGLVELFDSLRKPITRSNRRKGEYPYYGATGVIDYVDDYIFEDTYVLIGEDGAKWGENERTAFIVEGKCWVNNHVHVMKANPEILDDKYLICILNKLDLNPYITGEVNVPKLNQQNLLSITIPLPPLDVQKQIVVALDAAEKEFKKIENGIVEVQEGIKSKFLEMFGDPVSNPKGWQTEKLADVTTKIGSGATPRGGESSYASNGISLIRSMNVYNGYFKYDGLAFITDEQAKSLDGVTVQENDVLLNITGASVARTCVVPNDVLPARVNQHVSIIRCDSSRLNHVFANAALTTESYQRLLIDIGEAAGMSRQAITKAQIESLVMILPPIKAQNDFAEFCNETYAIISNHQKALDDALQKRNGVLLKYL
jgi:type I restriction enzyme M protein